MKFLLGLKKDSDNKLYGNIELEVHVKPRRNGSENPHRNWSDYIDLKLSDCDRVITISKKELQHALSFDSE